MDKRILIAVSLLLAVASIDTGDDEPPKKGCGCGQDHGCKMEASQDEATDD
jgi:hypothetical protein